MVLRGGNTISIGAAHTRCEVCAIATALEHADGPDEKWPGTPASAPRLRRAWLTDKDRLLMVEEGESLDVLAYSLNRREACDLALALENALNTEPPITSALAHAAAPPKEVAA